MSSGLDLRKKGARKTTKGVTSKGRLSPLDSIDRGAPGEIKISNDSLAAMEALFLTSPSIQAARQILMGQLLSSGIRIRRKGKDVKLTESFERHLEQVWLPFARQVVDSFLKWGFVIVSLDEESPPPFGAFSGVGPTEGERSREKVPTVGDARKRSNDGAFKYPVGDAGFAKPPLSAKTPTAAQVKAYYGTVNLVPIVPDLNTYELSFMRAGRRGYNRKYRVFSLSPHHAYEEDHEAAVFFKHHPDASGNVVSSIACCFQSASFIGALEELALNAEVVRARSQIVTQQQPRQQNTNALDPANLFFDSESRAIQSASATDDDQAHAANLSLSMRMCNLLNRIQTHNVDASGSANASVPPPQTHVPPEVPPRLFTVPDKHVVVPNLKPPEARSDLVDLIRVAAMGVPASVIFEGKFSSNSMSQLQLLNTTVASMAISVNDVLTQSYHACYNNASGDDTMELLVSPLASTTEVEALYNSQLIDFESAIPAALHSLGATSSEITAALERKRKLEAETKANESQTKTNENSSAKADVETKKANVKKTEADVEKVKADTELTKKQAKAPIAASGSSSSSSSSNSGSKK